MTETDVGVRQKVALPEPENFASAVNAKAGTAFSSLMSFSGQDPEESEIEAPGVAVDNPGDESPEQMSFSLQNLTGNLPTLGGLVGYSVAPFKEEWLLSTHIDAEVSEKFIVVAAPEGELAPGTYRMQNFVAGSIDIRSTDTVDPARIEGKALGGLIKEGMDIPQFSNQIEITPVNLDVAMPGIQNAVAFEQSRMQLEERDMASLPQEELHREADWNLVTAKATLQGAYNVDIDADFEIQHVITVSPEDYERVKAELDQQEIMHAHLSGSISLYNPGEDNPELVGDLYMNAALEDISLVGDFNNTVAMASAVNGQELAGLRNIDAPQPPAMLAGLDPVTRAQVSINLLAENDQKVLVEDGIAGPKTTAAAKAVLGDDYSSNWAANAQALEEMIEHSPVAQEKIALAETQNMPEPEQPPQPVVAATSTLGLGS